ncbi:MAG: Tat pathway signal protein [Raoultibacter sp.]
MITRRHFLYGALGVGALAAAAAGGTAIQNAAKEQNNVSYLEVPQDAVFTLEDCTEIPVDQNLRLVGSYEFPYGTLAWSNNDSNAACLLPTESAKPLTQVGIIDLASGTTTTILEGAIGQNEGFEIYDVRASEAGLIWTEANILKGTWRIYTATLHEVTLGVPTLVDQDDSRWETPSIAAVGTSAFWQRLPKPKGEAAKEDSLLRRAIFGSASSEVLYSSKGRMSTPIYPLQDSVVITPRVESANIYHQLTRIGVSDGQTLDSLILPAAMKPLEAGYGPTGFTFSFDSIYNYGEGIANLGTYVPKIPPDAGNYGGLPWFRFDKTPSAAPAWCGNFFMVKSTRTICGINLADKTYFSCDVENGCEDWGDYLATTGTGKTIVTFANIDTTTASGEVKKHCRVRIWSSIA